MKRRLIKKWHNYFDNHCNELLNGYRNYCHKRLYQYFPYTTDCALRLKKSGFNLINWPELIKRYN